jgi:hypothetical protein
MAEVWYVKRIRELPISSLKVLVKSAPPVVLPQPWQLFHSSMDPLNMEMAEKRANVTEINVF